MEGLRENVVTYEIVQELLPDFEISARRAVEGVLGLPTFAPRGFRLTPSNVGMIPPSCCAIQCWNTDYSLTLSVGIHEPDLDGLVPGAGGGEIVLDAVGEVINVLAGRVLGVRRFVGYFGRMAMTPPLFSDAGLAAKEGGSMHGMLVARSTRLYFGFMLAANGREAV